eukprot:6109946-Lingulodinium_polyedra.AAC.1
MGTQVKLTRLLQDIVVETTGVLFINTSLDARCHAEYVNRPTNLWNSNTGINKNKGNDNDHSNA